MGCAWVDPLDPQLSTLTKGYIQAIGEGTVMIRIPGPAALPPSVVFPTSVWNRIVEERRKKLLETGIVAGIGSRYR